MKLLAGIAVAVILLLFAPNAHAQTITTPCAGGAWQPNTNCAASGVLNMQSGTQMNGAPMNVAMRTLTNAEVLALGTTAITIIPVPPTGYVHIPIYGTASLNLASVYSAGSDLKLFYTSRTAGNAASGVITNSGFLDNAASATIVFTGVIAGLEPGTTARAIAIQGTALTAFGGGNSANSLKVTVFYYTVPTGTLR